MARKRHMSGGGSLFIIGMIGGALILGVYRFVTGHLLAYWEFGMWVLIALSIVSDVYFHILDAIEECEDDIKRAIDESTDEVKERLRDLEREIGEIKEQCGALSWNIDGLKTESDEFIRETRTNDS